MRDLEVENGNFTRIVNAILEKLALFPFPEKTSMPIRLTLFVIRKTWGYNKKEDFISLTQFTKGLNSNRPSVVHWLDYLVKANILVKGTKPSLSGTMYRFNKYYEEWKWGVKATQLVKARKTGWLKQASKPSNGALTHKRKKDIFTKDTLTKPTIKNVLSYFQELNTPNEAEPFFDHFESNGWKVGGKTTMKDWKAAARNWLRSPYRNKTKKTFRGKQELLDTANDLAKEMKSW